MGRLAVPIVRDFYGCLRANQIITKSVLSKEVITQFYKIMRLHHFFLNFVNESAIIKYNAVGVENIVRQIGQMISPADRQGFLHTKEGESLWQLVIRSFGNY